MNPRVQLQVLTTREDSSSPSHQPGDGYEVQSVGRSPAPAAVGLGEARFVDPVTITVVATLSVLAFRMTNHWLNGA